MTEGGREGGREGGWSYQGDADAAGGGGLGGSEEGETLFVEVGIEGFEGAGGEGFFEFLDLGSGEELSGGAVEADGFDDAFAEGFEVEEFRNGGEEEEGEAEAEGDLEGGAGILVALGGGEDISVGIDEGLDLGEDEGGVFLEDRVGGQLGGEVEDVDGLSRGDGQEDHRGLRGR